MLKIAIVNDTMIAIEAMRRVIATIADYQIVWIARDGSEAVAKCASSCPDLILMDLHMPKMDGVAATRQIMQQSPCSILIVTATVHANTAKVFEAMGYGALDVVRTPILGLQGQPAVAPDLLHKIATIAKLIGKSRSSKPNNPNLPNRSPLAVPRSAGQLPPLIAIGASTGGPNALASILSELPQNFEAAIVVVQHIDAQFTPGLGQWLNQQTPLTVELAIAGTQPTAGKVLLAATNEHLVLKSDRRLYYTKQPSHYIHCPSVDVLFSSLAQHWTRAGIGLLLTGMGKDGAEGLSLLRRSGWHTIAQDQASCVVYGMPKAAIEAGAAVEVLPIEAIGAVLRNRKVITP
ncbi:response regulator receiver modulated CheB methylesterase [Thalassoporum mexicanum PCC 7367]|uniref:chemotaxis response regulator protein-glutamate methylesterase n=1 Tax=Thalassoporum mexicanum TaxID=3457544 RepID=UPI00029F806E|nr:chemotaxis response regulator protein-glutamate methylesterase [Pseudanabaena sp. PCC 7367]AFY71603.1 response regulator receiver modulated CheB methylesterase [Pseudanabaena sp. PCC 7367]